MYRSLRLIQLSYWKCLGLPKSGMYDSFFRPSNLGCSYTYTSIKLGRFTSLSAIKFHERSFISINAQRTITHAISPGTSTQSVRMGPCAQYNQLFLPKTTRVVFIPLFNQSNCYLSSGSSHKSPNTSQFTNANRTTLKYIVAIAIAVVGLSYAAVPLYRVFCQASGYGGTVALAEASEKVEKMEPIRERELTIRFNADTSAAMLWQFKPQQSEIKLVPGETALAFYTARNPTDKPVTGIATYNVIPFEAGLYFNKIQCFCFEEQRLNPKEQVDMPVFFYIDPEFNDDPAMAKVDSITLSYTFFEAKEEENIQASLPATI